MPQLGECTQDGQHSIQAQDEIASRVKAEMKAEKKKFFAELRKTIIGLVLHSCFAKIAGSRPGGRVKGLVSPSPLTIPRRPRERRNPEKKRFGQELLELAIR